MRQFWKDRNKRNTTYSTVERVSLRKDEYGKTQIIKIRQKVKDTSDCISFQAWLHKLKLGSEEIAVIKK